MPPRLRCPPHAGADVAVYDQTSVGPELMLRLVRCRCPWSCSDHTRVEGITLRLDVPGGVAPALEPALRRAIEQCTVH